MNQDGLLNQHVCPLCASHLQSFASHVAAAALTSCWAEADQDQTLHWPQLVSHSINDLPDRGGHRDPDGGVGVVAAVDFEQNCRYDSE